MPFDAQVAHWRSVLGLLDDSALQAWFRGIDHCVLQDCEMLGGESSAQAHARRMLNLETIVQALKSLPETPQRIRSAQDVQGLLGTPTVSPPLVVLASWDKATLQLLIDKLTQDGFASDEDRVGLAPTTIKHWNADCTRFLRTYGYADGELVMDAKYYAHVGNIHLLYDRDRHGRKDAAHYMDRLAKRHAQL